MNHFHYFAAVGHAVVRSTLWLGNGIKAVGRAIHNAACLAGRATWNLLRALWRHPIVTTTVTVGLVGAWLYLGWVPLLSGLGVVALLGLALHLTAWLYRRLAFPSVTRPVPPPINPQRNGRPVNRTANPAFAGAV